MKTNTRQKFYIKQRHNPQLGTYYVAMGPMSKRAAKQAESTLYGSNRMLAFYTIQEYEAAIQTLVSNGEAVQ